MIECRLAQHMVTCRQGFAVEEVYRGSLAVAEIVRDIRIEKSPNYL